MASLDQFLQDLDDLDDEQAEGADEEVQDEEVDEDEDIDMMGEDVQPASTSGLLASGRLDELIERIEDLMVQTGPTDSEAEYAAIVACNEMVIEADTEVMSIAKNIKDDYAKRFPEKHYPKTFDCCGSSHNIFHVLIIIAAVTHIKGAYHMYLERFDKVCPIQAPI